MTADGASPISSAPGSGGSSRRVCRWTLATATGDQRRHVAQRVREDQRPQPQPQLRGVPALAIALGNPSVSVVLAPHSSLSPGRADEAGAAVHPATAAAASTLSAASAGVARRASGDRVQWLLAIAAAALF